jgi:mono/diheme cytochrome c family protein
MSRGADAVWMGLLLAGCGEPYGRVLRLEGDAVHGLVIYQQFCASCHGDEGLGIVGPSLYERVPQLAEPEILATVEEGPGDMPSFAGNFSDQDLADLLRYLVDEYQ